MWSNRSTLLTDDARTVVSDSGEILSPKYAPEIIAPAVMASGKPSALPIPRSATPTVAMVVQDDPVSTDTSAQSTHAVRRNTLGLIILTP